jgi:hypothetical protein
LAISEPGDPPAACRSESGSASGMVESILGARRLLTINTGSSSLKAALYRLRADTTETPELWAEASRIGDRGGLRLSDEPLPGWTGRLRRGETFQRGDRPHRGLGGTPDHRRMPRGGQATPDRISQGARGARPSPVGAGNPRRRRNPGGHGSPARTATGEQEGPCPGRRLPRAGDRRPSNRKTSGGRELIR